MISFYDEVNYHVPGETYFAEDSGKYYLVDTRSDWRTETYELTVYEEVDMPAIHRSQIGETRYADTDDEAIEIIDEIIDDFSA